MVIRNHSKLFGYSGVFGMVLCPFAASGQGGGFTLPLRPWPDAALEPHISARTMSFHYGKHHQTYVDNLNKLAAGAKMAGLPLDEIIRQTAGKPDQAGLFNNAAQDWNHTFFWKSMKPNGGGAPAGRLAERIKSSFGSFDAFKTAFSEAAMTQFGSGWAWLVQEGDTLKIVKTSNADTPARARANRAADVRRLGARLLSRLPEPPQGLRPGIPGPSGELGLRGKPAGQIASSRHTVAHYRYIFCSAVRRAAITSE